MVSKRRFRRGQIMILFVLLVPVLFSFAGLGFDAVVALVVKSHLVTTIDATSLAALRVIPQGRTAVDQAASRTFDSNFPEGWLMTLSRSYSGPTVEVVFGGQKLTLTGTAMAPTFFMGLFGVNYVEVNAMTVAVRRDINLVLVLDYSSSLNSVFDDVQTATKEFVKTFDDANDQLGLVSFSTAGRLDYPPQTFFENDVNTLIDSVEVVFSTNSSLGLWLAYESLLDLTDPEKFDKYNVIILFTDGAATSFTNTFPVSTDCSTSGGGTFDGSGTFDGGDGGTTDDNWSGDVDDDDDGFTGSASFATWGGIGGSWGDEDDEFACCLFSPIEGVIWRGGKGLYNKDAPAPPVPGQEWIANCSGSRYVEDFVLSIPENWHPAGAGTEPTISIYGGPNVVTTSSLSRDNLTGIAENMQVDMADAIRQDPLGITIFTIGLGNVDKAVMARVANDPRSLFYNANQPEGEFVYASNISKLLTAFKEAAGGIARLSQ